MSDALGHLAFLYPNFFVLFLPLGSPAFTPTEDAAAAAAAAGVGRRLPGTGSLPAWRWRWREKR